MNGFRFFPGLHHPRRAAEFDLAFVSVNALRHRPNGFRPNRWIMDSGAFTELERYGRYRFDVETYAAEIRRFAGCGLLEAAVAQDFMCEPFMLDKTGLTVAEHQALTIERYDALIACDVAGVYIMPVLQGFEPAEYAAHVKAYGDRLAPGAWVGVGSVCKRQGDPRKVVAVLEAILAVRPDLRLHGFGMKISALKCPEVVAMLATADSMAWSFSARKQGRAQNDYREACYFERQVASWTGQVAGELAQEREEAEWGAIVRAALDGRDFSGLLPPAIGQGDLTRARLPSVSEMLAMTEELEPPPLAPCQLSLELVA